MSGCGNALPALRLLNEQPNEECDPGWDETKQEDVTPGDFRIPRKGYSLDDIAHVDCEKQAHWRGSIEDRAGFHPPALRDDLRDHGCARRPLASDAETRDDPENDEKCDVLRVN